MRSMSLLASVLLTSLVVATVEGGCSSSSTPAAGPGPFDSGTVTVPEAGPTAGSVAITVVGSGYVVSADGTPQDGGPNGFVGADGGAPTVDCSSSSTSCSAPQGITLYEVPIAGSTFNGWTVQADGGTAIISTDTSIQITPGIGSPLTATFSTNVNGPDAAPIPDAGSGGG
jgi:hypothetical protein